jgi:hypothetical protein
MSLCVSVYLDGNIQVWADGRVSATDNFGKKYLVTDEYPKARQIGSRVIFTTGIADISADVLSLITDKTSLEDIQSIAREKFQKYKDLNENDPSHKACEYGIEFAVTIHEIRDGVPKYVQMVYNNDFEITEESPDNAQFFAFGSHSGDILPVIWAQLEKGTELHQAVLHGYEHVTDVSVGGRLTRFQVDTSGVKSMVDRIRSAQQYPKWPGRPFTFHADMAGNVIANSLTANSARINSSSFNNGAIVGSSINVNDKFTVTSGGIMSAVDGNFSGSISASTISGGTITGAKLRTAGDGVYPRVEIDPSSVAFGVYADPNNGIQIPAYDGGVSKIIFNANGNQSVIFNSPSSGFFLSGYGRATLNGDGVKLEPGSDYVRVPSWNKLYSESSHISLQEELSAIWSALANKANAAHSHTVSIPNHNHGNPANANSGGGTFTAS